MLLTSGPGAPLQVPATGRLQADSCLPLASLFSHSVAPLAVRRPRLYTGPDIRVWGAGRHFSVQLFKGVPKTTDNKDILVPLCNIFLSSKKSPWDSCKKCTDDMKWILEPYADPVRDTPAGGLVWARSETWVWSLRGESSNDLLKHHFDLLKPSALLSQLIRRGLPAKSQHSL